MSKVLYRVALGVLAGWILLLLELSVFVVTSRGEISSIWELQHGVLWLLPTALSMAIAPAALGGALIAALEGAGIWARASWALTGGIGASAVAWGVSTGRHFEDLGMRLMFTAVAACAAAGVFAFAASLLAHRFRRGALIAGATALLVVSLELVNRFVLVRLYPAFHTGLTVLCLGVAAGFQLIVEASRTAPGRRKIVAASVGAVGLLALFTARPAAARLAYFDNFRLLVADSLPLWGSAVGIAARLAPPAPLSDEAPACDGSAACRPKSGAPGGPSFRGRDVLLVSVDALRADHVGAYGYGRATTPNIDSLAAKGVVFENAYCPSPHTSYSVTSLMTGKYVRPLLLQGAGHDSDTLATLLRTYGYKTGAFYPPAVFFIDPARFTAFKRSGLGFEYQKVEFKEGEGRVAQVSEYLSTLTRDRPVFVWVHLFGPHEPYEAQPGHAFGDRDVDRYDSEVAAADATIGSLLDAFERRRARQPVTIVTADHGEEFGEHGGRYHGTSVYEEQVRVPLVIAAPSDLLAPRRVKQPVQTIDIMPTVLDALGIPRPARVRGRTLRSMLEVEPEGELGFAFAETEEFTLLAEGIHRLICARKLGACRLYDLRTDPGQRSDASATDPARFETMRARLRAFNASHGQYEMRGLRAEGKGWPPAILRGIAGDADAAPDVAALLEDADKVIRRKAAEVLFELRRPETAAALRLSLGRDEDPLVKKWAALALTRLGEGAPLARELLTSDDIAWRRLAALALAESGDGRGKAILVDWWQHGAVEDHERALQLLAAFRALRDRNAVWPLVQSLDEVRLRPHVARTLAAIGDETARGPLAEVFATERYHGARVALAESLVALGARTEIARPLTRFLGTPDPLDSGLATAVGARILEHVGGPDAKGLDRLKREARIGVTVRLVVPKGGNGSGTRVLVLGRAEGASPGQVRVGWPANPMRFDSKGAPIKHGKLPSIRSDHMVVLSVPPSASPVQVHGVIPDSLGLRPGLAVDLVVYAEHTVVLDALAVVPLADELPPPPPAPWTTSSEKPSDVAASGPSGGIEARP